MTDQSRKSGLSKPTPEQEILLQAWRSEALAEMPYFARILFSLRTLNAPGLGTWAVDAHHRMYIDFDAVVTRGTRWNAESVLHEASHLFADHAKVPAELGLTEQTTKQLRQTVNLACDLSINDDLDAVGCITFRDDKVLPEFIGEPNNQTPHHYFNALQKVRQAQSKVNSLRITIKPNPLIEGRVNGAEITVQEHQSSFFDPHKLSLFVTKPDESAVAITNLKVTTSTITFTVSEELPVGAYEVKVICAGKSAQARLSVVAPSIAVIPDHIEKGWSAPRPVRIVGSHTNFSSDATVKVTPYVEDGEPAEPVAVSGPEHVSATAIVFDLVEKVPDGLYIVTVTDGSQAYTAAMPVGLPYMSLNPESLPVRYTTPQTLQAAARDFTFDQTTTVEFMFFGLVEFPGAADLKVKAANMAEFTLAASLPEGSYKVVAMTGGQQAYTTLSISDDANAENGDGRDRVDGGNEAYQGCGSGSGGGAWEGELEEGDDFGGYAPAVGGAEKLAIQVGTAAAMKDYVQKGRGTVPAGLMAIADKVLAPSKTPWQRLLASAIRRRVGAKNGLYDTDRSRRNRRKHNQTIATAMGPRRVVYPAYQQPVPSVHVIRDTSGSMSANDLAVVTREIESISKKMGVRGEHLIVTDVDATTHGSVAYKGRASIREVHGRGGTNMTVGIMKAWEQKTKPTIIVVVTDGLTPWPTAPGPVPVVACIVPSSGASEVAERAAQDVPEWIKTIVVDPAEDRANQVLHGLNTPT